MRYLASENKTMLLKQDYDGQNIKNYIKTTNDNMKSTQMNMQVRQTAIFFLQTYSNLPERSF